MSQPAFVYMKQQWLLKITPLTDSEQSTIWAIPIVTQEEKTQSGNLVKKICVHIQ